MRANTSRGSRLQFDGVADAYDSARPKFAPRTMDLLGEFAGLAPGDHVLEIGAGTGQLTADLVTRGLTVLALEPGHRLAQILRAKFDGSSFEVHETTFEEFHSATSFRAVVAANTFHWLDPGVSYPKAADLLAPRGTLAVLWNFPMVADHAIQDELNRKAFTGELEQLIRRPETFHNELEESLSAGRSEAARSGRFGPPQWTLHKHQERYSQQSYIDLIYTLASAFTQRHILEQQISKVLSPSASIDIELLDYLCTYPVLD